MKETTREEQQTREKGENVNDFTFWLTEPEGRAKKERRQILGGTSLNEVGILVRKEARKWRETSEHKRAKKKRREKGAKTPKTETSFREGQKK